MFRDRQDAGEQLAALLDSVELASPVVLALPRGGVPVAAVVAEALDAPLDVIVVRKLGMPGHREFALGAIAEGGARVLDDALVERSRVSRGALDAVEREERDELDRRVASLRRVRPAVDLRGRDAVIVDDGLATGATARAACLAARERGAARVVLAVPCAPRHAASSVPEADGLVVVESSSVFGAVGQFYADFAQVDDAVVLDLLSRPSPGS